MRSFLKSSRRAERSIANFIDELGKSILRELTPLANQSNLVWDDTPAERKEDTNTTKPSLDDAMRFYVVIADQNDQPVIQVIISWYFTCQTPDIIVKKGDWVSENNKGVIRKEKFCIYDRALAVEAAKRHIGLFAGSNNQIQTTKKLAAV